MQPLACWWEEGNNGRQPCTTSGAERRCVRGTACMALAAPPLHCRLQSASCLHQKSALPAGRLLQVAAAAARRRHRPRKRREAPPAVGPLTLTLCGLHASQHNPVLPTATSNESNATAGSERKASVGPPGRPRAVRPAGNLQGFKMHVLFSKKSRPPCESRAILRGHEPWVGPTARLAFFGTPSRAGIV